MADSEHRAFLASALAAIAATKVVLGLTATVIAAAQGMSVTDGNLPPVFATTVTFAATGAVLFSNRRRDERAGTLGTLFLAIASVFADPLVVAFLDRSSTVAVVVRAIMSLQVDAFVPFLLWQFVLEFPHTIEIRSVSGWLAAGRRASGIVGAGLFAANILVFVQQLVPTPAWSSALLGYVGRYGNTGLYWPLCLGLCLPALPAMVFKAQQAGAEERRRVALLVAGLLVGLIPSIVWIFAQGVWRSVRVVFPLRWAGWLIYPTLLSTPLTTAYAVLVRRALDVRVVIRRALQYALARYSVMAVAAIPALLLALSLYRRRQESLAHLATMPGEVALLVLAAIGVIALRRRSQVLARIDRLFFREQYDARHILGTLVGECRHVGDVRALAGILRGTIDSVLHLDAVAMLLLDDVNGVFASPEGEVRPLSADAALVTLLGRSQGSLDVDLERRNPALRDIPSDEQHWLVDGAFRLLLAVRDASQRIIGVIALGEKKSELPFSTDDLALLAGVVSATEMAIAYRNLHHRSTELGQASLAAVSEQCASECTKCGAVQPHHSAECLRCSAPMTECVLPQVIGGKFLIDERIGAGAMGVVYRGMDVHLGRLVAIKTLPNLFADEALRLRREARAMASVSHRNLATIFGAETWQGRPMLICEYLPGGTLADRLTHGPIPISQMIELGEALASVLVAIHRVGVLHRDIKPSNIGFASDTTPKLLDFGIARILTAASSGASSLPTEASGLTDAELVPMLASESALPGTPLYMSPEALLGAYPNASFDLWSLAIVLYESIAGRHPFVGDGSTARSRLRVRGQPVPDLRNFVPSAPGDVVEFFARSLSSRLEDRPRTAEELHSALTRLSKQGADSASGAAAGTRGSSVSLTPPGELRPPVSGHAQR